MLYLILLNVLAFTIGIVLIANAIYNDYLDRPVSDKEKDSLKDDDADAFSNGLDCVLLGEEFIRSGRIREGSRFEIYPLSSWDGLALAKYAVSLPVASYARDDIPFAIIRDNKQFVQLCWYLLNCPTVGLNDEDISNLVLDALASLSAIQIFDAYSKHRQRCLRATLEGVQHAL